MKDLTSFVLAGLVLVVASAGLTAWAGEQGRRWKVEKPTEERRFVTATAPGLVTFGNQIRLILFPEQCNQMELTFSFFTHKRGLGDYRGKTFQIEMTNRIYEAELLTVIDFPVGALGIFSVGHFWVDDLLTWPAWTRDHGYQNFYVQFLDGEGYEAASLFDITEEHWAFDGYDKAINKAERICKSRASNASGTTAPQVPGVDWRVLLTPTSPSSP